MKPFHPQWPRSAWLATSFMLCGGTAWAQTSAGLQVRSLAATCASCHGTEGAAVPGDAMVRLAGLPKDYFVTQMQAFRNGTRPATVMHQISRGYTPGQIETLANYFANLK